jgi:molybdopterin-guanine dinucleotide biosynthesis protein A
VSAPLPVYLLAGGRASRFGSDKARALYQGQTLLQHAATAAAPWASTVSVIAQRADQYADLGLVTYADRTPGQGPMGGLATALAHAPAGYILVGSCDVLGLTPTHLAPLIQAQRTALALAFYAQHWHPLWALYHTDLLPEVILRLQHGNRALWRLLSDVAAQAIPGEPFATGVAAINTRADLAHFTQHP